MAGLFGGDDPQGGLLGIDPYALATIAQLFGAKKGDNYGLNIANIESQRQAAMNRAQQGQLTALQIKQAQQAFDQGNADRAAYAAAPNFSAPTAPNMAPTPENAAQLKAPTPYDQASRMVDYLRSKGVSQAYIKPYLDQMEKFRPKAKADQQMVKMPDGSIGLVNIMDDGTTQVVPYKPAEKQKEVNLGGTAQMVGEYSGMPGMAFGKTVSPDTVYSGNVTMRGQNMTDARDRVSLAYNTGFDAPKYGFNSRQIPGVDTQGMAPATVAQIAADVGKKQGEAVQQARLQLPAVEASTKQTIDLVDKLLTHPGFSTTVGMKGPTGAFAAAGYPIPGTDAADFVTLQHQVVGKQFLQAYEILKGAGQITEVEGKKATSAIAAMDNAQSEAAYTAAAKDFQGTLRGVLQRMQSRASGNVGGGFRYLGKE